MVAPVIRFEQSTHFVAYAPIPLCRASRAQFATDVIDFGLTTALATVAITAIAAPTLDPDDPEVC